MGDPTNEGIPSSELLQLLAAALDQGLEAADGDRLGGLLRDKKALRLYVNLMTLDVLLADELSGVDAKSVTPGGLGDFVRIDSSDDAAAVWAGERMFEAMILPALHGQDDADTAELAPAPCVSPAAERKPVWRRRILPTAAAAVLVLGLSLLLVVMSRGRAEHVATLSATAGAVWAEPASLNSRLEPGRTLRLRQGVAELTLDGGARVLLQGRGELTIVSESRVVLGAGSIYAFVPSQAAGFVVTRGALFIRDLGTEFGVTALADGQAEVHVIRGKVEVGVRARDDDPTTGLRPLAQGQAVRYRPETGSTALIATSPETFVRDVSARVPLDLRNTGVGLAVGQADPAWSVTAPSDASGQRVSACVAKAEHVLYAPNDPASSQWVSVPPGVGTPAGLFTYRISTDLHGLDPSTARVDLRVLVDDALREVRLNGRTIGIDQIAANMQSPEQRHKRFVEAAVTTGFVDGLNDWEFVVENVAHHDVKENNLTAFRLEWSGSAVRKFERAGSAPPTPDNAR